MAAIAAPLADIGKILRPPLRLWRARARLQRLRRLWCTALEGMNAASPDVAPEFSRFPFP